MKTKFTAYRFRIYPNQVQRKYLARTFGCVRYVYNWGVSLRCLAYNASEAYGAEKKGLTYTETAAILSRHKKKKPWLKEVSSQVLQQSLRDLDTAYKNFHGKRARYPRFKRKHSRQSARFPRNSFSLKKTAYGLKLYLAKMPGEYLMKVNWHRVMDEEPSSCTVVQESSGRYYVAFVCERQISPLPKTKATVGIDLGLTDVVVTSDGWKSGNPRFLAQALKRLRREQQKLARKTKGSNNFRRQVRRIAKAHAKVKDARSTWIHQLTKRLVEKYDVICVESLAVKNMQQNRSLARAISDVGWGELVRQLEYKAEWYGKQVVKVNRFFPSSKTCSRCDHICVEMPLDVRHWKCERCGAEHDRDINAAENVHRAGLAQMRGLEPQKAPGQRLSPCGTLYPQAPLDDRQNHAVRVAPTLPPDKVTQGCLRIRGDSPRNHTLGEDQSRVPPHTRG